MTQRKQQRPSLRAVTEDDVPAKKATVKKGAAKKAPAKRAPRKVTPVSVTAAARSGDHRQLLVALGNRIAKSLDDPGTTGPAFAALVRQAREIAADIQALDEAAKPKPAEQQKSILSDLPWASPWDESMI